MSELAMPSDSTASPSLQVALRRASPQQGRDVIKVSLRTSQGRESEPFGVVENRVSNILATLWDRGFLDHLDATVARAHNSRPMMIPLRLLLFVSPSFGDLVASELARAGIDIKAPPNYDPAAHDGCALALPAAQLQPSVHSSYAQTSAPTIYRSPDMEREQLDEIYKSLRSGADLEQVDPPLLVSTPLYTYQKQALSFLLDRERVLTAEDLDGKTALSSGQKPEESFPLWKSEHDARGRRYMWSNVITRERLEANKVPPQTRGALLADEMGLGKTLVIISLIAFTREQSIQYEASPLESNGKVKAEEDLKGEPDGGDADDDLQVLDFSPGKTIQQNGITAFEKKPPAPAPKFTYKRSRATLVLCPLSTVRNWESQIREHTRRRKSKSSTPKQGPNEKKEKEKKLSIYIYHGPQRTDNVAFLANHDVVITTYSTLGVEFSRSPLEDLDSNQEPTSIAAKNRKRKKTGKISPLHQISWFRVVLDEAHIIKEYSTIQARAACALEAQRRICLTGTPLQNSLNDLFSLVRFLRVSPFTERSTWTEFIGRPVKRGEELGISRLQIIMRAITLRRTKTMKDADGKPILQLPKKHEEVHYLTLDDYEKSIYETHRQRYKTKFLEMQANDKVLKNYCHILEEILRLRQICADPSLVKDAEHRVSTRNDGASNFRLPDALRILEVLRDTASASCAVCGYEFSIGSNPDDIQPDSDENSEVTSKRQRGSAGSSCRPSGANTPLESVGDSSQPLQPIVTRCQHVFCPKCFDACVGNGPDDAHAMAAVCSICETSLSKRYDVVDLKKETSDSILALSTEDYLDRSNALLEHAPSTKVKALINDLIPFSQANHWSRNCAVATPISPNEKPVKSVVFSQWTTFLDRIENALDANHIQHVRLDGTMDRAERDVSLDVFNHDYGCEVLLISIRAGGVGLNLTAGSRIYVMEPNWNPAVEHQAQDRIHRLGQRKEVNSIRYVIRGSIEENMLLLQKEKMDLAARSLKQTLSKKELQQQRVHELSVLLQDVPAEGPGDAETGEAQAVFYNENGERISEEEVRAKDKRDEEEATAKAAAASPPAVENGQSVKIGQNEDKPRIPIVKPESKAAHSSPDANEGNSVPDPYQALSLLDMKPDIPVPLQDSTSLHNNDAEPDISVESPLRKPDESSEIKDDSQFPSFEPKEIDPYEQFMSFPEEDEEELNSDLEDVEARL